MGDGTSAAAKRIGPLVVLLTVVNRRPRIAVFPLDISINCPACSIAVRLDRGFNLCITGSRNGKVNRPIIKICEIRRDADIILCVYRHWDG